MKWQNCPFLLNITYFYNLYVKLYYINYKLVNDGDSDSDVYGDNSGDDGDRGDGG